MKTLIPAIQSLLLLVACKTYVDNNQGKPVVIDNNPDTVVIEDRQPDTTIVNPPAQNTFVEDKESDTIVINNEPPAPKDTTTD